VRGSTNHSNGGASLLPISGASENICTIPQTWSILSNMKVVVLYRPNTENSRQIEDFARDLKQQYQTRIEMVNLNTRDGSSTASLYDVMQNPAVLVLANDGQLIKEWQGTDLPLMNEVSYYTHI
jgi:hypothetical protein